MNGRPYFCLLTLQVSLYNIQMQPLWQDLSCSKPNFFNEKF